MKTKILILGFILSRFVSVAHPPWGLEIDAEGNFYFADIFHNERGTLWKLSHDGKLEALLKDFHAHNVDLDSDGNVISAHGEDNHTMIRLLKNGQRDTLFHTTNFKEFFGGNCTYTPQGDIIFHIEKFLWKINAEGQREKISDHEFNWSQTIYSDALGKVYVPDIGVGNGSLLQIGVDGKATVIAENLMTLEDGIFDPTEDVLLGITKDAKGNIYIAETGGRRIIKIDPSGSTEDFYSSNDKWFPTAIEFFQGDSYVLEFKADGGYGGPRIAKITAEGEISEVFNYDTYTLARKKDLDEDPDENRNVYLVLFGIAALLGIFIIFYKTLLIRKKKVSAKG